MLKPFFKIIAIFLFLTFLVKAEEFDNILINGNSRISDETIIIFSELPTNQSLSENSLNDILKRLYKSGFFKDVVIKVENKNLIIDVVENPIIQTVYIDGIKRKKTEEALYELLSMKSRSSFNLLQVKKDEENVLSYLKNDGFYFSEVISSYQDLGDNKVDLFYKINLGEKAKIAKISFIGDKKFKDATLRNIILSEEYKFWKIISGKKFLNENMINFDKRLMYNFYKNKGFYNIKIESSFASYLGNNEFELIYNISSGKKYYFNDLILKLPVDYDEKNFEKLRSMFIDLKGENYSLNSIDKILNEIDKVVLYEEYEFLKSTVNEDINDDLINLTFNIEESEKFYIEKINILGNTITQESVIRNTLSVDEGDAFNELLHKKTLNKLRSLNYFKNIDAQIIDGTLNSQKIINLTVEEKPTGEITAGAGFGTGGGTLAFNIKENNFLGRGIEFGTDLSFSTESVRGIVTFIAPNYKGSNRSLNFSAESVVTDRLSNQGYESNKTGFVIGSGLEIYDNLILNTGISAFTEKLTTDKTASASLKKQEGSFFDTYFNYTLDYDLRNQKYKTTDGFRSLFTQNVPVISEGFNLTNSYDLKFYNTWLSENILTYGIYGAATNSITGKDVKLSNRLYLPDKKLRGFEKGKVGPKDGNDYVGGNYIVTLNASTTLPQILPNLESTTFALFFDAGNIWGVDYASNIDDSGKIRSSAGIAIDVFTPIGPLSFSFSEPITKHKNDITESFRFNLGTTF